MHQAVEAPSGLEAKRRRGASTVASLESSDDLISGYPLDSLHFCPGLVQSSVETCPFLFVQLVSVVV